MAFPQSPGVYAREIDLTGIVPGAASTDGAFVGPFLWGPVKDITLVGSEKELYGIFRGPAPSTLANNDGQAEQWMSAASFLAYADSLFVVRVTGDDARNAYCNTSGDVALTTDDAVVVNNTDDFDGKVANAYFSSHDYAPLFIAKYPGTPGNGLLVSYCSNADQWSSELDPATVVFTFDSVDTATGFTQINTFASDGTTPYDASALLTEGELISWADPDTGRVPSGKFRIESITSTYILVSPSFTSASLKNSPFTAATGTRYWKYVELFDGPPGTSPYAEANNAEDDEIHAVVIDGSGYWTGSEGTALEIFPFASQAVDAKKPDGSTNYITSTINSTSQYVWFYPDTTVGDLSNLGASITNSNTIPVFGDSSDGVPFYGELGGGVDDNSGSDGSDNELLSARIEGFNMFDDAEITDISLIIMGNANATLIQHVVDNLCHTRYDCVAFASPEESDTVRVLNPSEAAENDVEYKDSVNRSSSYLVWDSGHKVMYDRYNDVYRNVPLNGDIAGLCAQTDELTDPWFSPAGPNRGLIKNAVKLHFNPRKAQRDILYKNGINPVVAMPGIGIVLWGDKTALAKPSAFDRINVRRLFIVLRKSISRAAKFQLFEFNDELTRARFRNIVEPFLRDVQGRRGIFDFKVVASTQNNTPEVIDRNEFVGDILVKPARSINFITLNFVAARTGVNFSEIGG